ncbi:MAG: hypothetical protein KC519_21250, partial [Anaerolineae bacterium]|nr:hypothetical protein [Anaerolineae bacterium]
DYKRYLKSKALQSFIKSVKPIGYFADERIRQFALWYLALETNMGEAWVSKPAITEIFCNTYDVEHGLRPYRLQTRYWRPDDDYKQEEAINLVNQSREQLMCYYAQYKATLDGASSLETASINHDKGR